MESRPDVAHFFYGDSDIFFKFEIEIKGHSEIFFVVAPFQIMVMYVKFNIVILGVRPKNDCQLLLCLA